VDRKWPDYRLHSPAPARRGCWPPSWRAWPCRLWMAKANRGKRRRGDFSFSCPAVFIAVRAWRGYVAGCAGAC
jgi:hypothetical protein